MLEILKSLQEFEYLGAGKYTEIAKGKHEMDYSLSATIRKIKRTWASRGQ